MPEGERKKYGKFAYVAHTDGYVCSQLLGFLDTHFINDGELCILVLFSF